VRAGDLVVKRSIYRGNVRWTFPHRYVGDWDGRLGIYCGPGNEGKGLTRGPDGYLRRWMTDVPVDDLTWQLGGVLRFERPGDRHNIEVCWTPDWSLRGWYVNLQTAIVVHDRFLDSTDQCLDIWVDADGSWRWKDEDDLEEAVALGIWTEADAAEIRAEGERVIAERPWPTGWEDWRPPADWGAVSLPDDWHVV
jgi:Protein of unknown function (DUF402)